MVYQQAVRLYVPPMSIAEHGVLLGRTGLSPPSANPCDPWGTTTFEGSCHTREPRKCMGDLSQPPLETPTLRIDNHSAEASLVLMVVSTPVYRKRTNCL